MQKMKTFDSIWDHFCSSLQGTNKVFLSVTIYPFPFSKLGVFSHEKKVSKNEVFALDLKQQCCII